MLQPSNSALVSISSNSLAYMSNQRLPNEDIQKVRDLEDRLIITTFKEATGKLEGAFNQLAEYLSGRCVAHQYYIKLFVTLKI